MRALDEKYFHPVDDPFVAVLDRLRGELLLVRTNMWLSHGVTREASAVEQRLHVRRLLLGRAVVRDDLGIAGIGSLRSKDDGRPLRHTQDLVQQGELDVPVSDATKFGSQVGDPETRVAHRLLHRVDDRSQFVVEWVELSVGIQDVMSRGDTRSRTNSLAQSNLEFWLGGTVPGHQCPPCLIV